MITTIQVIPLKEDGTPKRSKLSYLSDIPVLYKNRLAFLSDVPPGESFQVGGTCMQTYVRVKEEEREFRIRVRATREEFEEMQAELISFLKANRINVV